ncbi:hypothetical protein B296_00016295 [Ensete ventricosum]|uniref:Uncharacterized protein n=1 Tax=Ensete ventricosum TaxID=4639 RepID=A0A426ZUB8_ENSVE|nr:hypothetical protein B296_00016295 [Ensete ventricosum]
MQGMEVTSHHHHDEAYKGGDVALARDVLTPRGHVMTSPGKHMNCIKCGMTQRAEVPRQPYNSEASSVVPDSTLSCAHVSLRGQLIKITPPIRHVPTPHSTCIDHPRYVQTACKPRVASLTFFVRVVYLD